MATFGNTGGGAALGNPQLTRQGIRAGATQATPSALGGRGFVNPALVDPNAPPPKASAAKKATGATQFTGLAEALNNFQQKELVAKGVFEIADIYEIEFVTPELTESTLAKQGGTVYSKVPMQQPLTAKTALDSKTNKMDTKGRTVSVSAGMQIVQFIETQVRGSSYITSQASTLIDKDGNPLPSSDDGQVAWYKINVVSTPLGYDKKRNDFAYHMKFIISPYAVSSVKSEYFPKNRYRGSHKSYNYWFTGKNIEILNFEQSFNSLWTQVITSSELPLTSQQTTSGTEIYKRVYMARSNESDQGAASGENEPAANLADLLYNTGDQGDVKLQILGDPAWLQQGEIASGISASTFNFSPFNPDGGINYDASEIVFDITWNRPTDYDFNTGLMPATAIGNQNVVYRATVVKHMFKKGRFEQEITGSQLVDNVKMSSSSNSSAATNSSAAAIGADNADTDVDLDSNRGDAENQEGYSTGYTPPVTFETNGGGAAFGNPRITMQGLKAGATQAYQPTIFSSGGDTGSQAGYNDKYVPPNLRPSLFQSVKNLFSPSPTLPGVPLSDEISSITKKISDAEMNGDSRAAADYRIQLQGATADLANRKPPQLLNKSDQ